MDEKEREIRQRLKDDFKHYASRCLKIRPKGGQIIPFVLNEAQIYVHNCIEHQKRLTNKVRVIILKGRQQGISTLIQGRYFWLITHRNGVRAYILTHLAEASTNIFDMAQIFYQYCPIALRPSTSASSAKEMFFGKINSGYKVGTAGNKTVGRSSTIQYLHGSEVAFWPNADEHAKGVMQAVSNESNTEIIMESTANGIGNYFHEQWQLAEAKTSNYFPIFVPWYWQREYVEEVPEHFHPELEEVDLIKIYKLTAPQLMWRRFKIKEFAGKGRDGTFAFKQEYPCNPVEAFETSGENTFILPVLVTRARHAKCEAIGPLIVGVDPARFGDDRTSIIYRRGRRAYGLRSYSKKDTMEVAGIIHKIIITDNPDAVAVDVGGLGAGVVDRLFELGHKDVVYAINSGSSPLDGDEYLNKRAEMWGELRTWLVNAPVEIPDEDSLHADMCGARYKYDSLNRLVIEPKDQMKKRGIRSPDEADSLCLTFAIPSLSIQRNKIKSESIASDMMAANKRIQRIRTIR